MTNKEICKENQKRFDKAYDDYWHTCQSIKTDYYWKTMFECVYLACMNHCKRLVKGLINAEGKPIQVQDLDGKACEAAIKIMEKIKNGVHPSLSAYPYLWCYGEIFGIKSQRIDKEPDLSLFENVAYYADYNDVYLCKESYSTNYSIGEEYND